VVFVGRHGNLTGSRVHHGLELAGFQSFHGRLLIGFAHVDHERAIAGHVDPHIQNGKQQNGQTHQDEGHGFFDTRLLHHLLDGCQRAGGCAAAIAVAWIVLHIDAGCERCQCTARVGVATTGGGERGVARTSGGKSGLKGSYLSLN